MNTAILILLAVMAPDRAWSAPRIRTVVSILPQAYFVERIGGPYVEVEVLVGPGQSPATYEPTPKQMTSISESRLFFRIGVPFEKGLVPKLAIIFEDLLVIDTREGVPLRLFKGSDHGSSSPDPHIWLDTGRVKIMGQTICRALKGIDPTHASDFEANLRIFEKDLDRTDAEIAARLAPFRGRKLYTFHPAFGYFLEGYGLKQVTIEKEGKDPGPKQLSALIKEAREEGVRAIFVQPQHSKREALALAESIGAKVVPLDPLPRDYLNDLYLMADTIHQALSSKP